MDDLLFTIVCLAVGAIAGFLGGLLGIGGGVIVVPSLILLFDAMGLDAAGLPPGNGHTLVAVGTSLASIVFTSAAAARAQMRARMVEWSVVKGWAGYLVLGSYAASLIAIQLPTAILRLLICAFLLFVSYAMLTSWRPSPHRSLPGPWLSATLSSVGGLIAGVAGIGGGNVVVPTLIYHNVPVHRAIGTASVLGFPIAIAGSLGYIHRGYATTALADGLLGYVYLPALAAIVAATVFTAPLGVRASLRTKPAPLRRIFGCLLLLVAARMLWSAL